MRQANSTITSSELVRRVQGGILPDVPAFAAYVEFDLRPAIPAGRALRVLQSIVPGTSLVVGIDPSAKWTTRKLGGFHPFPEVSSDTLNIPRSRSDVWVWIRGDSANDVAARASALDEQLGEAFVRTKQTAAFCFEGGRDLTGYEDGTENPTDDNALDAAFARNDIAAPVGSSFVAVQTWLHDMGHFRGLAPDAQDNIIGRHRISNEEFDAPPSAHVKRTAQEDFDPEAFILRRSMPWRDGDQMGLIFVAFGRTFDAYEQLLRHMCGHDDGVVDALFQFSRPLTGAYYWCPPVHSDGRLNLDALFA